MAIIIIETNEPSESALKAFNQLAFEVVNRHYEENEGKGIEIDAGQVQQD